METWIREPNNSSGFTKTVDLYDGLGRLVERKTENRVQDIAENTVTLARTYNPAGQVSAQYEPFAGSSTLGAFDSPAGHAAYSYTYDVLGRVTTVTRPNGIDYRKLIYDTAGVVEVQDEDYTACAPTGTATNASCPGSKVIDTRDAFGRLVAQARYAGNTLDSKTVRTFDAADRLLTFKFLDNANQDGGSLTSYTYDSFGRVRSMTDPNSGTWLYQYDLAGNLVFSDDPKPTAVQISRAPVG